LPYVRSVREKGNDMELFQVIKVPGGFAVRNWTGEIEVIYKNRKFAEQYADGAMAELVNAAEEYGLRLERARRYLAERAARPVYVNPQMDMFA